MDSSVEDLPLGSQALAEDSLSGDQAAQSAVKVAVNIRPLLSQEQAAAGIACIKGAAGTAQLQIHDRAFTFDDVYEGGCRVLHGRQEDGDVGRELYDECVCPLVEGLFMGYNATVLAYGQTGSGKTFTMGTRHGPINSHGYRGVTPRAMDTLFRKLDELRPSAEFRVRVSFVEIHRDEIRDLLDLCQNPRGSPLHQQHQQTYMSSGVGRDGALASPSGRLPISIRELPSGMSLQGAVEQEVDSQEEMLSCLENGLLFRTTGSHSMNARSSRSHAIFTIFLEQRPKPARANSADDASSDGSSTPGDVLCAKLHLVDLAGSERLKRTQAEGDRLQEGIHINKGLLALANVISALSSPKRRRETTHIPYRDSKLTRLLQDSLGGNSKTVLIACISPTEANLEETLNTLRYATRARCIQNKPQVNWLGSAAEAEAKRLKQQVEALQAELVVLRGGAAAGRRPPAEPSAEMRVVSLELKKLRAVNAKLVRSLSAVQQSQERGSCLHCGGGKDSHSAGGADAARQVAEAAGARVSQLHAELHTLRAEWQRDRDLVAQAERERAAAAAAREELERGWEELRAADEHVAELAVENRGLRVQVAELLAEEGKAAKREWAALEADLAREHAARERAAAEAEAAGSRREVLWSEREAATAVETATMRRTVAELEDRLMRQVEGRARQEAEQAAVHEGARLRESQLAEARCQLAAVQQEAAGLRADADAGKRVAQEEAEKAWDTLGARVAEGESLVAALRADLQALQGNAEREQRNAETAVYLAASAEVAELKARLAGEQESVLKERAVAQAALLEERELRAGLEAFTAELAGAAGWAQAGGAGGRAVVEELQAAVQLQVREATARQSATEDRLRTVAEDLERADKELHAARELAAAAERAAQEAALELAKTKELLTVALHDAEEARAERDLYLTAAGSSMAASPVGSGPLPGPLLIASPNVHAAIADACTPDSSPEGRLTLSSPGGGAGPLQAFLGSPLPLESSHSSALASPGAISHRAVLSPSHSSKRRTQAPGEGGSSSAVPPPALRSHSDRSGGPGATRLVLPASPARPPGMENLFPVSEADEEEAEVAATGGGGGHADGLWAGAARDMGWAAEGAGDSPQGATKAPRWFFRSPRRAPPGGGGVKSPVSVLEPPSSPSPGNQSSPGRPPDIMSAEPRLGGGGGSGGGGSCEDSPPGAGRGRRLPAGASRPLVAASPMTTPPGAGAREQEPEWRAAHPQLARRPARVWGTAALGLHGCREVVGQGPGGACVRSLEAQMAAAAARERLAWEPYVFSRTYKGYGR